MINNRQVNLWRGNQEPPTIYHIWIKDNSKMLLYDGEEWVVFLDNKDILDRINEFLDSTVNGKPIKDNPVLDGTDINLGSNGTFVSSNNTIAENVLRLDTLLTTQIIK